MPAMLLPVVRPGRRQDRVDEAVVHRLGRVMNRSRSMSSITVSTSRPEWRPMISAICRVVAATSRAAIWMSEARREPGAPLMDHQLRVRKRKPLAGCAARHDHRRGRHAHAEADRRDVGAHVLHRVVDRHARVRGAAGRVDVERDVALGVVGLEQQELGDDQVRDLVVDLVAEEDDAFAQEARVDVERALPRRSDSITVGIIGNAVLLPPNVQLLGRCKNTQPGGSLVEVTTPRSS